MACMKQLYNMLTCQLRILVPPCPLQSSPVLLFYNLFILLCTSYKFDDLTSIQITFPISCLNIMQCASSNPHKSPGYETAVDLWSGPA